MSKSVESRSARLPYATFDRVGPLKEIERIPADSNLPTLWIIGDSTVKNGTKGEMGWGEVIDRRAQFISGIDEDKLAAQLSFNFSSAAVIRGLFRLLISAAELRTDNRRFDDLCCIPNSYPVRHHLPVDDGVTA